MFVHVAVSLCCGVAPRWFYGVFVVCSCVRVDSVRMRVLCVYFFIVSFYGVMYYSVWCVLEGKRGGYFVGFRISWLVRFFRKGGISTIRASCAT